MNVFERFKHGKADMLWKRYNTISRAWMWTNVKYVIFLAVFIFVLLLWHIRPYISLENIQKACIQDVSIMINEIETAEEVKKEEDIDHIIAVAKYVSRHNGTVLVSVVNDAYLPFAYSWLCNTKHMNIHKSVLVITGDRISKYKLNKDWPEINVVKVNLNIPPGNQEYSRAGYLQIMIRRTELLLELLNADLEILLLEFDYMWFSNPLPNLQKMKGVDFLVNPVSTTDKNLVVYNGGFLYMFPTKQSKALWSKVTDMMHDLGKQIELKSDSFPVSQAENDQVYFSALIREGFADVKIKILPLHTYADGKWYYQPKEHRIPKPLVISNNFVLGNVNKMKRAKDWSHWFLRDDCTCDFDLVRTMVYR